MVLVLSGCASPAYYYQAVSGHMSLMGSRQDIQDYLDSAPVGDPWAHKLELAQEVIGFAETQLLLPADGSYESFANTGRDAVIWNLVVTPEFSLTPEKWCFPVSGCVPYRGYFDESKAHSKAARYTQKGKDVSVSQATAYSTLGWFRDPLLDTMLDQSDTGLAATLIHELAHQKVYVKSDTAFNESFATFVEHQGVRMWMTRQDLNVQYEQWEQQTQELDRFHSLLLGAREDLEKIYESSISDAEKRVRKQARFEQLHSDGGGMFESFFDPPPNNADLALIGQYFDGTCAFRVLFERTGEDFPLFYQRVNEKSKLADSDRQDWLETPCQL